MFKPELWQSQNEYRTIVNTYSRWLSHNYSKYFFGFYDKERQKLLNFNLDAILEYILPFYSPKGHPTKNQAQILRSHILFVLLFNKTPTKTSLTFWVTEALQTPWHLPSLLDAPIHRSFRLLALTANWRLTVLLLPAGTSYQALWMGMVQRQ